MIDFKDYRFELEITHKIYHVSYRQLEEMMREYRVAVVRSSIRSCLDQPIR